MKLRVAVALMAAAVLSGLPARAETIPPDFRSAFEGKVRRNRTYGVVVQKGVPTTSIYGVDGKQTNAYFSVDIKGGDWEASKGLLDFNQVVADYLVPGEVMEVVDVTFKDDRIDLRMVSVEAHKVTRGSGFGQTTKREPSSTNFKFFFPFLISGAQDLPQAMAYIESWVRLLPSEEAARAFSAQLLAGGAPVQASAPTAAARATPTTSAGTSGTKEIKVGMTPLEVIDVLGRPQKEVSFENKTRWTYPDLTVLFENGRVKEVRF
jgi:hypothetical protein